MRVVVVDVGSNTARVLVADVTADGCVTTVAERRRRLGLGAEIARTGTLSRDTIRVVARTCRGYARLGRELGAERAEAVVTAPGRQGCSTGALVAELAESTRLRVRVLSAEEEGRLAFDGAVARSDVPLPGRRVAVVDVGGGSTEIVVGTPFGAGWVSSVDLGSIRLARRHLRRDPPRGREVEEARVVVREAMRSMAPPKTDVALATGGSARAVAKLVGPSFDAADVQDAIDLFARKASAKVGREAGIHPVRAASVLGGALLLQEAARVLDRRLVLARGGVREGAVLELARRRHSAAA